MVKQLEDCIEILVRTSVCQSHPCNNKIVWSEVRCRTTEWEEGRIVPLFGGEVVIYREEVRTWLRYVRVFLDNKVIEEWCWRLGKLRRILRFVHCNFKERRCFGATSIDEIFTWVDESYAVHHDMKSRTRGVISMILDVTHCISSRTKLNTKSSTEA